MFKVITKKKVYEFEVLSKFLSFMNFLSLSKIQYTVQRF